MLVCISVESVVISPLLFLLHLFGYPLFCFFINLASGLLMLLIFSKNQLLDLLIFLKHFLCLYLLQLCSDLSYFLSSARFWVFLIFHLWRYSVNFRSFFASHEGIYCYIFSSRRCFKCVPDFGMLCLHSRWFRRTYLFLPSFHFFIQSTFKSQLFSFHEVVQFWASS